MSEGGIDVYRIGLGRDVYFWWRSPRDRRLPLRTWFTGRPWHRRSYWGVWQAESEVIPINAARGLTAKAARRRLSKRITQELSAR